ncbi:MAG: TonB-dependent receptor, partial [Bacteroidaceae bacterium]
YSADKGNTSFLKANKISNTIKNLSTDYNNNKWDEYIRYNDPFKSSFSINQQKALPNFGASLGWGKTYTLKNDHKLNLLFSVSANHTNESKEDAYVARLKANGTPLNEFTYDSYTSKLTMAGLLSVGYTLANNDTINYTLFFARNAIDDYKMREGQDAEEVQLVGSNSVAHIYTLFNNQLAGKHKLGDNLTLNWKGSYSSTSSDEPDRRQVMYEKQEGTSDLRLFTFNSGTMRYFGELTEKEAVGDVRMTYRPKAEGKTRIHFGGTYKNKRRDYSSIAFFYDLQHYKNNSIQNIYQIGSLINREQIENGQITIQKYFQPRQSYYAGMDIAAGFIETDYALNDAWLINLGLRYEHVNQWVKYWNDGGTGKRSSIQTGDLFPALNIKYSRNQSNIFRLSLSRTITRPSFIEMAPFLYSESYGSAEIRGNDQLKNAYNYNADLRYEFYPKNSHDLFSITLYYKYLDKPIEQVQEYSGGSPQQTFYNADKGMAAGVEMEYRKEISKNLQLTMNGSYMYTNVDLPSSGGGNYTEAERELQGASPYLGNADLVYSLPCKKEQSTLNFALIYNVQGPRIHSVGTNGAGDVKQEAYHTLNFVSNYTLQKHWSFKIEINNLLNSTVHFKQTVLQSGLPNKKIDSEYYKNGTAIELGMNYKF